jgi:acetyltransferase-like isoleucine patch superfamily enzyme
MRETLKSAACALATLLVLPAYGLYRIGAALLGGDRVFAAWSQAFSLLPGVTGQWLRRAFYRLVLPRFGVGSVLSFGALLSHRAAQIGDHAYIGPYCCLGDVVIEDDALIASHVSITNGCRQHGIERLDIPVRQQPGQWPRITIGRDSWIGERSVVMANVGRHCVVGAGSVVTKPVPDYAIVVGVPARIVDWRGPKPQTESASPESIEKSLALAREA